MWKCVAQEGVKSKGRKDNDAINRERMWKFGKEGQVLFWKAECMGATLQEIRA